MSRSSFEAYVAARVPALLRFAYVLCGDRHLAEDLVQEALIRVHGRWSAIEAENPDAYVKKTIVRAHVSFRRRRAASELATATVQERAGTARFDDDHASREEVWALLAALPPRQRAVLVLRYFEDLDDRRIAELVGSSAVSVRVNAHRGLAALRETLTRRAEQAPTGAGMSEAVRLGVARASRRRRVAMGAAGVSLAALIAVLLLVLPYLWRGGNGTPPIEPTPTHTPSPLPTSTLTLVPAVRPPDPTFPYVFTAVPDGYGPAFVEDIQPPSIPTQLRLTYPGPGGSFGVTISLTPDPWDWDWEAADTSQTTVNGIPATLRSSTPSVSDGCIGVTWQQDGNWITVQTCHEGLPDSLTVEDILGVARSIQPGTTVSTPAPSIITAAGLPAGYAVQTPQDWGSSGFCASPMPGQHSVCVWAERIEETPSFSSDLVVDGYPALDWVGSQSPFHEGPPYTLTVYRDMYKIHVATTQEFTLVDRIAIYRTIVLSE